MAMGKICTPRISVGACAPCWNLGSDSDGLSIALEGILPFIWKIVQVQNGITLSFYLVKSKVYKNTDPFHCIPLLFSSDWQLSCWGGWLSAWFTYTHTHTHTTLSNVSWVIPSVVPSKCTFSSFALCRAEIFFFPTIYVLVLFFFFLTIPSSIHFSLLAFYCN